MSCFLSCEYNIITFAINHSADPVDLSFKVLDDIDQLHIIQADSIIKQFKYSLWSIYGDSILVRKAEDGSFNMTLPPESTAMIYKYLRDMSEVKFEGKPFRDSSGYITHWGFYRKQVYNWPAKSIPPND